MSLSISAFFTFLIEDPEKPILCPHQEEDIDRSPPVNVPSAAVLEISENMRAKIYSIFCKLGKENLFVSDVGRTVASFNGTISHICNTLCEWSRHASLQ